MRHTRPGDLLIAFVIIGLIAYVLLRWAYADLPPLQYLTAVPLAALAIIEYFVSRRVRAAIRHDPGAKPMAAIAIARCVALGKASAVVGAGVGGAAVAVLLRVLPTSHGNHTASSDEKVAIVILIASIALVAAGLLLERSATDPHRDDRRDDHES